MITGLPGISCVEPHFGLESSVLTTSPSGFSNLCNKSIWDLWPGPLVYLGSLVLTTSLQYLGSLV
jgi:hypothetical protein